MDGGWVYLGDDVENKYQKNTVFFLQLKSYSYNKRSIINNRWVLIVCQATAHNRCSKCPPSVSTHTVTRLIMDCRTLSKSQRRLQVVWQAPKCVREVSVYFQLEVNAFRLLSVTPKEPVKIWGQEVVPRNQIAYGYMCVDRNTFLVLV
jgi:hypothetical protein